MSLSCLLQVSHVLAMIMLRHTNNIPGRIEWRAQEAGKEKGPGRKAGRGWKGKWDKGCAPAQSSEPPSSAFLLNPSLPNAKGNMKATLNTNHIGHIGKSLERKTKKYFTMSVHAKSTAFIQTSITLQQIAILSPIQYHASRVAVIKSKLSENFQVFILLLSVPCAAES